MRRYPAGQRQRRRARGRIGGITVDDAGEHLVLVVTLDNLLKGAATQALQNANLACGFDELMGIR